MKITTTNPGLVLFLIDGSHSTGVTWGDGKQLLSESIMRQTNQFILDLVINAVFDDGEIRDRVKLSAFVAQGEDVNWAFEIEQPEEKWLSAEQWANSGRKVENSNVPIWVEYTPQGKTPLFDGWMQSFQIISDFNKQYPGSPVFMVTLTDGDFKELLGSKTDREKEDMKLQLDALKADESFVHLVVHISPDNLEPLAFPTSAPNDEFGCFLFDAATWMPAIAFENSRDGQQNRRAYILNADAGGLSKALELGSKLVYVDNKPLESTPLNLEEEEE